jgi:hypothetical protein
MSKVYYTGIGSRELPLEIKNKILVYGYMLAKKGLILRSGAADGADAAFELGCYNHDASKQEIYLPWKNFNNHQSQYYNMTDDVKQCARVVWDIHATNMNISKFNKLSSTSKLFMKRNCQQVTGEHLVEPSMFVLCYTKDGCETTQDRTLRTGGTGQAISYASTLNIPVFNFGNADAESRFLDFIAHNEVFG